VKATILTIAEEFFDKYVRVSDESSLTLRQADQARTDFAIIERDLEAIYARLARLPTYKEVAKMARLIAFVSAVLRIVGIEAFWRYFPAFGSI
jgi:hypothetical protein